MKKNTTALWINIVILFVGLLGVLLISCFAADEVTATIVFYDISIGLLSGAVVAIVFCLHDRKYEYRAYMRILNEYKRNIREMLPEDNLPTDKTLEELRGLALAYRTVLSDFGSDDECKKVNVAVAECLDSDEVHLQDAVQNLRQIVKK